MDDVADTQPTRRLTVPTMEARLYEPVPVLDHGFVRLVDYMGGDAAIVQAARVSYGSGTKTSRSDRGLIRYLLSHSHTTPFEMCEIKLHMKMPIFIARQFIRHRTANVNEISGRYSVLDKEFYLPAASDLAVQSKANKQGRDEAITEAQARDVLSLMKYDALRSYDTYESLLNDKGDGTPADPNHPMLARELARLGLSLNYYTQWYWKVDLHNLLHFLRLRMDSHAQLEAQRFANAIAEMVIDWVPYTWEAFKDFRVHAKNLSRQELEAVRRTVDPEALVEACRAVGLTERETDALLAKIAEGA